MVESDLTPDTEAAILAQIARHEQLASGWRSLLALLRRPDIEIERSAREASHGKWFSADSK